MPSVVVCVLRCGDDCVLTEMSLVSFAHVFSVQLLLLCICCVVSLYCLLVCWPVTLVSLSETSECCCWCYCVVSWLTDVLFDFHSFPVIDPSFLIYRMMS